jgi:hypothetical protein
VISVEVDGKVPAYKTTEGPVAAYRTALAAGDAVSIDAVAITALAKVGHGGLQNVAVSVRFSVAAATVVVHCLRYARDGDFLSSSQATLTAGSRTQAGKFLSEQTVAFDTQGAINSRFVVELPSAGTVDLYAEAF